ncbi:hypothetical protein NPIL_118591 [Nephila pilipes]|uniref:Uncharacterized protein n=1 Tax=Nephila pilipes TaxID=299642 RepID=A0A8X6NAM0_NEPPI|nr:hypothetical protein NPIL_118591 [Nephila pilipes]
MALGIFNMVSPAVYSREVVSRGYLITRFKGTGFGEFSESGTVLPNRIQSLGSGYSVRRSEGSRIKDDQEGSALDWFCTRSMGSPSSIFR